MREGIERHGPVREGVYAVTGYVGVDADPATATATAKGGT
jgi:hypothetical protein